MTGAISLDDDDDDDDDEDGWIVVDTKHSISVWLSSSWQMW